MVRRRHLDTRTSFPGSRRKSLIQMPGPRSSNRPGRNLWCRSRNITMASRSTTALSRPGTPFRWDHAAILLASWPPLFASRAWRLASRTTGPSTGGSSTAGGPSHPMYRTHVTGISMGQPRPIPKSINRMRHFSTTGWPVVEKCLIRLMLFGIGLGWPIEIPVTWVLYIGWEGPPAVEEPPVLGPVVREAKRQALLANSGGQLANNIAAWSHLNGVPGRERAVVEREAIVMFRDRHHKFRPGLFEERGPGIRIKLFRLEPGNEVLVSKCRLRTICFYVMLEFR